MKNLQMSPKNIFRLMLLILLPALIQAQTPDEGLKKAAIEHMRAGRYGEAIDLLNKFITANPRLPEGYHLRGLSFEKRAQYQYSVLDLRRARKLDPQNAEIQKDLDRVIQIWYAELNDKIKGHLREIAIDPTNPYNYLEIGKAHRWMEHWIDAEEWYDKYLERDDNASPDEIIRYSEILAKNNHIKKGEIILKKWVDRYPEDWRLWSRYGYFTLWLGHNKNAIKAFETALSFKPFFKEAQDGLDQAKREAYVTQYNQEDYEQKEFPIDRYYRILRSNPENDDVRFKLVDELIKAERIEEAYQQLQILGVKYSGDPKYEEKWEYVTNYRDEVYHQKIDTYQARVDKDANDREAVTKLAQYYGYLQEYDSGYSVLDNYFQAHPDEKDPELRFLYARMAAWARDFDSAIRIMDDLLVDKPENLDYQLFRAQLSVWNQRDLDVAREYLTNVLAARPNNLEALISMSSLLLEEKDFEGAQEYADKAKAIDPTNNEVIKLQSNIDFHKMRAEEEKLYGILNEGRELAMDGDCAGAIPYYEDYLAKAEPNDLILKEYGDILFCDKRYDDALNVYDEVLANGYYYEASLQRAKVLFSKGDSLEAVTAFQDVVKEEPYEFEPRLYLGDAYAKAEMYDSAKATYDNLMTWDLDSIEIAMVDMRYGWLPATGLGSIFETFPQYIGISPFASFYTDNLSYTMFKYGGRMEMGILEFLSLGVSFYNTPLKAKIESLDNDIITNRNIAFTGNRSITTFKGHLFFHFGKYFTAGIGLGSNNVDGTYVSRETDIFARAEQKDKWYVHANYLNSEGVLVLYSPYLIDVRLAAEQYRLAGYFKHPSGFNLGGSYQLISVPADGSNMGNDVQIRLGKFFTEDVNVGYEYYYANWRFDSELYYSPIGFTHHAAFVNYFLENTEDLRVVLEGKIGYVPISSAMILAGSGEVQYKILPGLNFTGKLSMGQTSRNDSAYRYTSGEISIYWNIY